MFEMGWLNHLIKKRNINANISLCNTSMAFHKLDKMLETRHLNCLHFKENVIKIMLICTYDKGSIQMEQDFD